MLDGFERSGNLRLSPRCRTFALSGQVGNFPNTHVQTNISESLFNLRDGVTLGRTQLNDLFFERL
ncbi:hypothetical protein PCPL58_p5022 (plasmid) [Pseudomonas cerasi]|nr:hypothetical protein PCPL58_p5022 [Pseudomonas cerasi]